MHAYFVLLQEHPLPKIGDRAYPNPTKRWLTLNSPVDITITLTFVRTDIAKVNPNDTYMEIDQWQGIYSILRTPMSAFRWLATFSRQVDDVRHIDVLAPVYLESSTTWRSNFATGTCQLKSLSIGHKIIYPDFLGVHMVRNIEGSTIISYHHDVEGSTTSAKDLYTRMKLVGRSVYW